MRGIRVCQSDPWKEAPRLLLPCGSSHNSSSGAQSLQTKQETLESRLLTRMNFSFCNAHILSCTCSCDLALTCSSCTTTCYPIGTTRPSPYSNTLTPTSEPTNLVSARPFMKCRSQNPPQETKAAMPVLCDRISEYFQGRSNPATRAFILSAHSSPGRYTGTCAQGDFHMPISATQNSR